VNDVIVCVVKVMDAADTGNVADDLENATEGKEDKEFLLVFADLNEMPESGKGKEDDCDNAER